MEHSAQELAALGGEHRLTEMELSYVHRALDSEMLGMKKCMHYVEEIQDEQAQELLREHADIHHRRIDMMLSLLESSGDITKQAKLLLQNAQSQGGRQHA